MLGKWKLYCGNTHNINLEIELRCLLWNDSSKRGQNRYFMVLFFLFLTKSQLNLLCSVSGTKITLKDGGIAQGKEGKMKRLWNIFLSQGTIFLASSSLLSNIVLNSLWGLKVFIKMTVWSLQRQRWRGTKKISKCIFMLLCSFFPSKVPGCFHGNSNFALLKHFIQKRFHFGYLVQVEFYKYNNDFR